MKKTRSLISLILAVMMSALIPLAALADETNPQVVHSGETVTVDGNLKIVENSAENYPVIAVSMESAEQPTDATTSFTATGDVSLTHDVTKESATITDTGLRIDAENNSAKADIAGDFTVTGAAESTINGGYAKSTVSGIEFCAESNNNTDVHIGGSLTVEAKTEADPVNDGWAVAESNGIYSKEPNCEGKGTSSFVIEKDLTAIAYASADYAEDAIATGIELNNVEGWVFGDESREVSITVGGNLTVEAATANGTYEANATGIKLNGIKNNATININVGGNVTATATDSEYGSGAVGIKLNNLDDDATVDIVIEGTLSAADAPLQIGSGVKMAGDRNDNVSLTVWQIEPDNGGALVHDTREEFQETTPEEAINYILRTDTILSTIVSALPKSVANLVSFLSNGEKIEKSGKTSVADGSDLYTAKEGEKVRVKVDDTLTIDGEEYSVKGMKRVNAQGEFLGDAGKDDGGYFFYKNDENAENGAVERGGGWWLRLILEKIVKPDEENKVENKEETKTETKTDTKSEAKGNTRKEAEPKESKPMARKPASNHAKDCYDLIYKIQHAPMNGTVEADMSSYTGLLPAVLKALDERKDVTLKLNTRDGEIVIAAGSGLFARFEGKKLAEFTEIKGLI